MDKRKLPLWMYAIPIAVAFALPNMATPLMELWRDDIGFSSGTLVLIFVAYLGGLAPAFLFAPALAQKFGQRRTLAIAIVLGLVSCLFYILGSEVWVLLIARIFTGFCSGGLMVLGTVQLRQMATTNEARKATLFGTLGLAIGLAAGPLIAGLVAQWLPGPLRTVYVIEGILLAGSLAIVLTLEETPKQEPKSWLPIGSVTGNTVRVVFAGLGAYGPGMTAASIVLALAPTILLGMAGVVGPLAAGLFAGGMYAVSPIAQSFLGSKRPLSVVRLSIAILLISMAVLVSALYLENLWFLGLAAVLIGAGQGMSSLGGLGLVHQRVESDQVASATSLLSLGVYVLAAFVPLLGGVLLDHGSLQVAGLAMGIGVTFMALIGAAMARDSFVEPEAAR